MSEALIPDRLTLREGSRLPALATTPSLGCDETWDGTAYSGYVLRLYGPRILSLALTYNATTGALERAWTADDVAVPGRYVGIVEATHVASGVVRRFPSSGGFELVIEPMPG